MIDKTESSPENNAAVPGTRYSFIIKDTGPNLDIVVTRAMLALAALTALVYQSGNNYYVNLLSFAVLSIFAIFIRSFLIKYRISKLVVLLVAALVLLLATHSISFAVILLVYGYLVKFLDQKPAVVFTKDSITLKKLFTSTKYSWSDFSNIILKDNLLTLDFKNNKLIQLTIIETDTNLVENEFNEFCKGFLDIQR